MSFNNDVLRIDKLEVQNYRKFESFVINFDQQLTVLVGDNGSGKSTLIDAACVALGSIFQKIENASSYPIDKSDVRRIVVKQGQQSVPLSQYAACISAKGVADKEVIEWSRSLNSAKGRTTRVDASNIIAIGERLQKQSAQGDADIVLPILVRYGTSRLWQQGREAEDVLPNRTRGYEGALQAASNESRMNAWFKMQSLWEWQKRKKNILFTTVCETLALCFDAAAAVNDAMVEYDGELLQLVFSYHDAGGEYRRDWLSSMSDGYRGTLSLIADIAYRMATLNPALGERVLQTPGVVLIDEIDLHLHPKWQARILGDLINIFPNVQFIVTTHSPIVVSSVPKKQIRVLGETSAEVPAVETIGRDAKDILNSVLGASSRPLDIAKRFASFNDAIDREAYDGAKTILDEIESRIGGDDPDVVAGRTTLELEELLS